MHTDAIDSGLGEALASYQPKSMSASTWERFHDDAVAAVLRLKPTDDRRGRALLSRLATFLADVAAERPTACLGDLLTREQVDGHLQRALDANLSSGTVQNRQGALNALLRSRGGGRAPKARKPERHLAPYSRAEIDRVLATALAEGSTAPVDLARTLVCGLAAHPIPTERQPAAVKVHVVGRTVSVGDCSWPAPHGVELPPTGELDGAAVQRGRTWAATHLNFSVDLRRLALTELVEAVRVQPAIVVLRRDGVGRDRLSTAVAAVGELAGEQLREVLRFPAGRDPSGGNSPAY